MDLALLASPTGLKDAMQGQPHGMRQNPLVHAGLHIPGVLVPLGPEWVARGGVVQPARAAAHHLAQEHGERLNMYSQQPAANSALSQGYTQGRAGMAAAQRTRCSRDLPCLRAGGWRLGGARAAPR